MASDFTMKAHDRLPSIQAVLSTNNVVVDLTTATSVKFIMTATPGGTVKVASTGVIADPTNGVVRYDWGTSDTDTPGNYQAEWEVTWPGPKKQTYPTLTYHTITILADLDNA